MLYTFAVHKLKHQHGPLPATLQKYIQLTNMDIPPPETKLKQHTC